MERKLYLYTSEDCPACNTMKTALDRLGVECEEVLLTDGMTVPPDVRSIPTLAIEKNGKRTTLCIGWPGSDAQLKKALRVYLKGTEKKGGNHNVIRTLGKE